MNVGGRSGGPWVLWALVLGACGGTAGGDASPDAGPAQAMSPYCAVTEASAPLPSQDTCNGDPGITLGAPLSAPDSQDGAVFIPFPETKCMNGTPAGISVRIKPGAKNLLLFMEGGGLCYDEGSCATVANPNGLPDYANNLGALIVTLGAALPYIDRNTATNPLKDWNQVFVHYCSGDLHSGVTAAGLGGRAFVGHQNLLAFLGRIVPTFPDQDEVLLVGQSAGAMGAILNYETVQRAFGCTPVHALFDSGFMLPTSVFPACMSGEMAATFGTNASIPTDCEGCAFGTDPSLFVTYLADKYPGRRFGVFQDTEDCILRGLLGHATPTCAANGSMPWPAATFTDALVSFRTTTLSRPNLRTFYLPSNWHTSTMKTADQSRQRTLAEITAGGTDLASWVAALVDPALPFHHVCDPAPAAQDLGTYGG